MGMTIIGLDPGSVHFGYAVLQSEKGKVLTRTFGTIKVPGKEKELSKRLHFIYGKLEALFSEFRPDEVAVEQVFLQKNPRSSFILAHARALGLLLCAEYGARLKEYSPRKIKLAVSGNGAASKESVRKMVCRILFLAETSFDLDTADALAIALCAHFENQGKGMSLVACRGEKKGSKTGQGWTLEAIKRKGLVIQKG